jgi:hypothetical protein
MSKQRTAADKEEKPKPLGYFRVRARRMGYLNHQRRREGDVFDIPAALYSDDPDCWFERVPAAVPLTEPGSLSYVKRTLAEAQAAADFAQPETAEHEGAGDDVL